MNFKHKTLLFLIFFCVNYSLVIKFQRTNSSPPIYNLI